MAATAAPTPARRTRLMAQGHGTTHGPVKRRHSARLHSARGQTRSARRPGGRCRGDADRDQGRLAAPGPVESPGPDRRRPRGVARRHAADGRDQRGVRLADPRPRVATAEAARPRTWARPSQRRGGPPRPKPTRPVTGRVDTTTTFQPRNQTTVGHRRGTPIQAQPPRRAETVRQDALRASTPTGPMERDRLRNFRRPKPPTARGRPGPPDGVRQVPRPHARARSRPSSRPTSTGWPAP